MAAIVRAIAGNGHLNGFKVFNFVTGNYSAAGSKLITTSSVYFVKEIKYQEKDNLTTIEGVYIQSPREGKVVNAKGNSTNVCPLCQLNLKYLKFTDVLILTQFMDSKGQVLPKEITGICTKQFYIVQSLIKRGQEAGLLPQKEGDPPLENWRKYNRYFEKERHVKKSMDNQRTYKDFKRPW